MHGWPNIVAHFGVPAFVLIAVGISRPALYKRINRDPERQSASGVAPRVHLSRLFLPWLQAMCVPAGEDCGPFLNRLDTRESVADIFVARVQAGELDAEGAHGDDGAFGFTHRLAQIEMHRQDAPLFGEIRE